MSVFSDIISEKSVTDYPLIVSTQGMQTILDQMKEYVCKIYNGQTNGTGFFCKFKYKNKLIKVLITCNHVLGENDLIEGKKIQFSFNNEEIPGEIIIDKSRKIFTDRILDTTIIQIKDEEKYEKCLELDKTILNKTKFINAMYNKKPIYILENPDHKIYASYGIVDSINENEIIHKCSTKAGASGSPILSLYNNKVIGMHKGGIRNEEANKGIILNESLNKFVKLLTERKINVIIKKNIEKSILNDSQISKDTVFEYKNEPSDNARRKKENNYYKNNGYAIVKDFSKIEFEKNNNFRRMNTINNNNNQQKILKSSNSTSDLLNNNLKSNRMLNCSVSKQDNLKNRNSINNNHNRNNYNVPKLNLVNNLKRINNNLNNNIIINNNLNQIGKPNIPINNNINNYNYNIGNQRVNNNNYNNYINNINQVNNYNNINNGYMANLIYPANNYGNYTPTNNNAYHVGNINYQNYYINTNYL